MPDAAVAIRAPSARPDSAPPPRARTPEFRTPADPAPIPRCDPDGVHDLDRPEYYLNRELTWLNFNFRVLHEAEDPRTPLLERVKFLAIVGSNLDEFFMKRIGGLKQQVEAGITGRTVDGRTPAEQIEQCYEVVRDLEAAQRSAGRDILARLAAHEIRVVDWDGLDGDERAWLRTHYLRNIYPLVTPQASDPAHPFPFISNLSLNLLVTLQYADDDHSLLARVKVPVGAGIPRFVRIADSNAWVPLESVMANNLDLLFPGMTILSCELFRVTRNAIYDVDEDMADDLLELIESGLRKQRLAPIVRLQVTDDFDPGRLRMLRSMLGLRSADVFRGSGPLGLRDLMELHGLARPGLKDPPHQPVQHPDLLPDRSVFQAIREEGGILLHHPYQAFDTSVLRFLAESARDPRVRAIKMTFYRMAPRSKIIDHLVRAAREGKQVAVVIELRARFDEAANIRWANALSAHGIHVTYGVLGLKTHCKVTLVVRQDDDGLRRYAHIGTGNYHAGTARLYCDHGLLTCDAEIGADLTELFNYLTTGFRPKRNYRKLLPAPKYLRRAILKRIRREAALHSEGSPGRIQCQMNALEDPEVTRALYRAAKRGVKGGPDRARHVQDPAGHSGAVRERPRGQHRRAVPSALADLLLPQRRRRGVLHRVGGQHGTQPQRPGGGACAGGGSGAAPRAAAGAGHAAGGPSLRLGDARRRKLHAARAAGRARNVHLPVHDRLDARQGARRNPTPQPTRPGT